jgi:hypothetical protein
MPCTFYIKKLIIVSMFILFLIISLLITLVTYFIIKNSLLCTDVTYSAYNRNYERKFSKRKLKLYNIIIYFIVMLIPVINLALSIFVLRQVLSPIVGKNHAEIGDYIFVWPNIFKKIYNKFDKDVEV